MTTKKHGSRPTLDRNENKRLTSASDDLGPPSRQGDLFRVEKQAEIDGVEMGVLENGVPFLTESGLSRMCGIDRKVLNRLAINWQDERNRPRGRKIAELLRQSGYVELSLFIQSEYNGVQVNAYSEPVCLALLEYYAFVVDQPRTRAIRAFRTLARTTFRSFIYDAVGYHPAQTELDSWRHFHDRLDMTMDSVPPGYFSVFREIASMIVPMIRANIIISDKVVPDISVGLAWSKYWKENDLEQYGERIQYEHEYPLYYPQANSNPQPAFCYPDEILGIFRSWLRQEYITSRLPGYLTRQTSKGNLSHDVATRVIGSLAERPSKLVENKSRGLGSDGANQERRSERRAVEIVHPDYQPSQDELNEDMRVDATFEEAVKSLAKPVRIRYVPRPGRKETS